MQCAYLLFIQPGKSITTLNLKILYLVFVAHHVVYPTLGKKQGQYRKHYQRYRKHSLAYLHYQNSLFVAVTQASNADSLALLSLNHCRFSSL